MNKLVCTTGMPGSGKSVFSDYFAGHGYHFVRFGQVVLDEIIKRKLEPSEVNQKKVREGFRKKFGMDAIAKLNYPKLKKLLTEGNVIADGVYSWSEYKFLKNKFQDQMVTVAIFAPPQIRYDRLEIRKPSRFDIQLRNHHFSKKEARNRDYAEIENLEKGGPIVMADYTILNTGSREFFRKQIEEIYKNIQLL